MGATKPTRQPTAPQALRQWEACPHSALGLGGRQGLWTLGSGHRFHEAIESERR